MWTKPLTITKPIRLRPQQLISVLVPYPQGFFPFLFQPCLWSKVCGLIGGILSVVLLVGFPQGVSAQTQEQQVHELIGVSAPDWTVDTWINSEPLTLSGLRGKVVLLRWWTAPGCPFCEASVPYLNEWHARFADEGLVVIGMYHSKPLGRISADVVKRLAQPLGMTFPLAIDPDWQTLHRYWLDKQEQAWTSVSFIIDQEGMIRYVHPGGSYNPEEATEIEALIERLLGKKINP